MKAKDTYLIKVWDDKNPQTVGWGECNLFRGLSSDDVPDYEDRLNSMCRSDLMTVPQFSSLIFGAETALLDLKNGGCHKLWHSDWVEGKKPIPINGLVWMGDKSLMRERIKDKITAGYECIKLKIGGIDFDEELDLIKEIRKRFDPEILQIRLDANGAFAVEGALAKLERLAPYHIHSIEQPIKAKQHTQMARICQESPIPIALDEDLIGITDDNTKVQLLNYIRPDYIILKPALCGGFKEADRWIAAAEKERIGWWATSALESNIGLNAIAQWTATKDVAMPQGLGTGMLYLNNFEAPMRVEKGTLVNDPEKKWESLFNIM